MRQFIGVAIVWLIGLTSLAAAQPLKFSTDSTARTSVFGVEGQGAKFVYVFDRSGSMSQPDNEPLAAAKAELLSSLGELGDVQQFYVIFYNEAPRMMRSGSGRLMFGTEANKKTAAEFIDGIAAEGGTRHIDALVAAIRMRPDVIFLLTDGDEQDDLTADDLARIERINSGAAIVNVIQFSDEPKGSVNRLVELARQTGGEHAYVDYRRKVER